MNMQNFPAAVKVGDICGAGAKEKSQKRFRLATHYVCCSKGICHAVALMGHQEA